MFWFVMIYANLRRQELSSMPWGRITVVLATVVVGLLVHGMHASKLGLYWDDNDQLMQPLQWADGNTIRFILTDTCGYFRGERPFAHLLMMIHRAAFAISVSALHWSLVLLLILNAVVLETIASKIVNKNWYVFAAGLIFLTYPLAPLQGIWPAEAPHLWASLLVLLTILFSWYGLWSTGTRRLRWFAFAAIAYIASILTHEAFALIPPVFVSLFMLSNNWQNAAESYRYGRIYLYKPAIVCLSLLVGVLGIHGLWRILILPMYGSLAYLNSDLVLNPIIVAKKIFAGMTIGFIPWPTVLERINVSPPPSAYVILSVILFVITWIITFQLLIRSRSHPTAPQKVTNDLGADHWVQAALIGIALVIAAVAAIGVSPVNVNVEFGVDSITPEPRVNFVAIIGIALALPALIALLAQWGRGYIRLVQRHPNYMRLFGIVSLVWLVYVGFIGLPSYGNIYSHHSAAPMLFARYSLSYGLMIVAYVFVVVLTTGTILLSSVSYRRDFIGRPLVNAVKSAAPRLRAHLLSWTVASLVLLGTLFHFSVKEELVGEWRRHKSMMEQLHIIAPAVQENTFVVIVHEQPRLPNAPYMTHIELSCYLLALYDDWSILGTTNRNIRFYPDGVEARYYGGVAMWLPPSITGPVNLYRPLPLPHISYDRIILLEFDGTNLRLLPEMEVEVEGDGPRIVKKILNAS
jgi:hypothetical protein